MAQALLTAALRGEAAPTPAPYTPLPLKPPGADPSTPLNFSSLPRQRRLERQLADEACGGEQVKQRR